MKPWFNWWLVALGLVLGTLVSWFVQTEVAPYPPLWCDQNDYLMSAYTYADRLHQIGPFALLGCLIEHDTQGLGVLPSVNQNLSLISGFLVWIVGVYRLIALAPQILFWIIWVLSCAWIWKWSSLAKVKASCGLALILSAAFPFVGAGGIFDFRPDFAATCLTGIATLAWMRYFNLLTPSAAWLAAAFTAMLIATRFITSTYWWGVVGLFGLFLFFFKGTYFKKISLTIWKPLVFLFGWTLAWGIWDRNFLWNYYVRTQLGSELVARGANETAASIKTLIGYYPSVLVDSAIGRFTFAILVLIFFFWYRYSKNNRLNQDSEFPNRPNSISVVFPLFWAFASLFVLTLNPQRAGQVVGVVGAPLVSLGVVLLGSIIDQNSILTKRGLIPIGLVLATLVAWTVRLWATAPFAGTSRADGEALQELNKLLFVESLKVQEPTASFTLLDFNDSLFGYGPEFYGREELGQKRTIRCVLPRQLYAATPEQMLSWIDESYAIIIPDDPSVLSKRPYQISRCMLGSFDQLKERAMHNRRQIMALYFQGVSYTVWVRT